MDSTHVAAVTFACSCAGGAIGFLIRGRLRDHHLTTVSLEVLKLTAGVVATLAALVLGLLVGGSKQFYDAKVNEVRTFVVNVALLDRSMSHYEPSLLTERQYLSKFTKVMIGGLWDTDESTSSIDLLAILDQVRAKLRDLEPQSEAQKIAHSRIMALTDTLMLSGSKLIETDDAAIPVPLFGVVDAWIAVIFLGFGVFAPPNRVTVLALGIAGAAVSMAVFLVVEMNTPFAGFIVIPRQMMEQVFDQITKSQQLAAQAPVQSPAPGR
jgi:hypothetical protein